MNNTLSVSAICHGTVIDHIPSGQAFRIIQLLSLLSRPDLIMVGVNLPSSRMPKKDLIKIEDVHLSKDEMNRVMAFAPQATINKIENFKVAEKISSCLPSEISGVFVCPNKACITHAEDLNTLFYLSQDGVKTFLLCHYCENIFDRDFVEVVV